MDFKYLALEDSVYKQVSQKISDPTGGRPHPPHPQGGRGGTPMGWGEGGGTAEA